MDKKTNDAVLTCGIARDLLPLYLDGLTSPESAACTAVSFSTSRLAVASSSRITGASLRRARAIEMRWRSPPERVEPFSPITVP